VGSRETFFTVFNPGKPDTDLRGDGTVVGGVRRLAIAAKHHKVDSLWSSKFNGAYTSHPKLIN